LFGWHASLFRQAERDAKIRVGMWRDDKDGPMQVVSGALDVSACISRPRLPRGSEGDEAS